MQVCERAASEGRASEALLLEWPRLALRFGRVKKALEASACACQSLPRSAQLWQQRLLLTAQQASAQVSYPSVSLSDNRFLFRMAAQLQDHRSSELQLDFLV